MYIVVATYISGNAPAMNVVQIVKEIMNFQDTKLNFQYYHSFGSPETPNLISTVRPYMSNTQNSKKIYEVNENAEKVSEITELCSGEECME